MEEEKVVRIKLHKQLLKSEREELKAKRKRTLLIVLLCFVMLITGAGLGFVGSSLLKGSSIAAFKKSKFDKIVTYFDSIWLYKNEFDNLEETMEDKAFYGMTNFGDDPYSTYMSKSEIESFAESINMNYVGIGAQYTFSDGVGTIIRVFKNSPAEEGGLMAGDILKKVDGKSLEDATSDSIKEMIVGEAGTKVYVTVLRSGEEIELCFIRNAIEYTCYAEKYDDYVVLDIMSFGNSTMKECINYLDECRDYSKLIIDLRDNSGGYQTSVQEVAGLFLGENVVVLNETDNEGVTKSFKTTADTYYDNFKDIVILTNANTASAAEVLTICLKEMHPHAIQVGVKTYGKGVVQSTYKLEDGSAIKITTSYWTSPNGVSINGEGVTPDIEVKLDDILYETALKMSEDEAYEYDSVSSFIKIAEQALKFLDYELDRTDGYFDDSFLTALNKYKYDNDLEVDGILDYDTYNAIISSVVREYSLNKEKDAQLQKAIEVLRG